MCIDCIFFSSEEASFSPLSLSPMSGLNYFLFLACHHLQFNKNTSLNMKGKLE